MRDLQEHLDTGLVPRTTRKLIAACLEGMLDFVPNVVGQVFRTTCRELLTWARCAKNEGRESNQAFDRAIIWLLSECGAVW